MLQPLPWAKVPVGSEGPSEYSARQLSRMELERYFLSYVTGNNP